jgi:ectoine hydroxylase-related dioxygenase (phytanoyl-CoA dioxygenase family)
MTATVQNPAASRERYESDGYIILNIPQVPIEVVQRASEGMDAVRRGEYDTGRPPQPSPWNPGDDPNVLCKIEMPQLASRAIFDLVSHPAIGAAAAAATGAQMVQVWWVQLLYKPSLPPGVKAKTSVGWHQDRYYWGQWEPGSELLTAWVALSDVTPESGPMIFVRGSQRWGLLQGSDFFAQDDIRANFKVPDGGKWEEAAAVLPPGGFSLHHNLTLHGSGPNTSGYARRAFAIHLRTQKSRPVGDQREGLTAFIDNPSACPIIYRA